MSVVVFSLRVMASRAVLAYGFNVRKLKELPCPLDKEMEAYERLEGTYRVKSTHFTTR